MVGRQKDEEPKTPTTRLRRKTSHGPASAETLRMGKSSENLNSTDQACLGRCSTAEQEIHAPSTNKKVPVEIDTALKKPKFPPGSSTDMVPKGKAKPSSPKTDNAKKVPKVNEKSLPASPKSTPKPLTVRSKGSVPPSKKPATVRSSGKPVANLKSPRKTIEKKSPRKVESKAKETPKPKAKHVAKKPAKTEETEEEDKDSTPNGSDHGNADPTQETENHHETAKKKAHALYMRYWRSVNQSWALKCLLAFDYYDFSHFGSCNSLHISSNTILRP